MKSHWNDERLRNLFERYNRIYWRGKLSGYRVVRAALSEENCRGNCNWRKKIIRIDTDQLESDRNVRSTLLHEMCHGAARERRVGLGHGVRFFAQMERLIGRGAPVTVGGSEAGHARILANVIPKRFPLLRAKVERIESRRQRELIKVAHEKGIKAYTITDDMIVRDFEDAQACSLPWRTALICIGLEHGLTDDTGRPVNAWARRVVRRGKVAHRRARRAQLQYERQSLAFFGKPAQQKNPVSTK